MIIGQPVQPGTRQIFRIPPHLTFDNHYSGDGLQQYAGETIKNISLLSTCARNKTPKDIPPSTSKLKNQTTLIGLRLQGFWIRLSLQRNTHLGTTRLDTDAHMSACNQCHQPTSPRSMLSMHAPVDLARKQEAEVRTRESDTLKTTRHASCTSALMVLLTQSTQ